MYYCKGRQKFDLKHVLIKNTEQLLNNTDTVQKTLSVSELNRKVKQMLEIHLPLLWVEGEISNFSSPSSGHWYFSLKDARSQVRCAMFKNRNCLTKIKPTNGTKVRLRARVSLYEGRGDYQLIVEHMEDAGIGDLQKQFDLLKTKLADKGLFNPEHKKALPENPRKIAIITSPTGAAIHDILSVMKRRMPSIHVTIFPTLVQGDDAAMQIIDAIQNADSNMQFDLILITRGGGSIEDLWAYNNEHLANSIFSCNTPIVSAVGHEIDFTIADFVADLRAPTPSSAAEIICPDAQKIIENLKQVEHKFTLLIDNIIHKKSNELLKIKSKIKHPSDIIQQNIQRVDLIEQRLALAANQTILHNDKKLSDLSHKLTLASPKHHINRSKNTLDSQNRRLVIAIKNYLYKQKNAFNHTLNLLDAVSPLNTMARGYAIATDNNDKVVHSVENLEVGQSIHVHLADGTITSTINTIEKK